MKIAILGAGAMGALVGAHLKKGGGEVYFIDVFEEHMRAIAENGLSMKIEGESGPQTVFVDGAEINGDRIGVCDAVIVLVKCYDTETAVMSNRALFGKDTIAVTLQNGLGGADLLAKHFDSDHIGLGLLKSSANLIAPGIIIGRTRFPDSPKGVYFSSAAPDTPYSGIFSSLEKLLCDGGMPAACCDNIEELIWDKLSGNVKVNGVAAILQLAVEDMMHNEDAIRIMNELGREVCEVARAKGIDMPFEKYAERRSDEPLIRDQMNLHYVSMVLDAYNGRRTEIDFINGAIVREGKKYGVPTPYNETVWRLVRVMQDTYGVRYNPD